MVAIQEEFQQVLNPNEVALLESKEQERLLRISLQICGTVVESLPTARCAPQCEKTVQALLCRNITVKSATLLNAIFSHRISIQDKIVTGFHISVSERFVPGSTSKASIVELIREGLVVLRKAYWLFNVGRRRAVNEDVFADHISHLGLENASEEGATKILGRINALLAKHWGDRHHIKWEFDKPEVREQLYSMLWED
ncbi:hypothetical protein C5167_039510 [Papaver somniferum]|uniref:ATP synthase protein MI25 n=1 Tax=Papaver somniferum TaxID=3469 RepID=A0A4Y7IGK6_PAPSO|nr:hypothetical protein C5167_039510 [Papaver somniferum]